MNMKLKKEITVKKKNLLLAVFICMLGTAVVFGDSSMKSSADQAVLGDSDVADTDTLSSGSSVQSDTEASSSSTSKTEEAEEKADESSNDDDANEEGLATLPDGPAYVGVYSTLNLRGGVYGNILAELENNEKVTIVAITAPILLSLNLLSGFLKIFSRIWNMPCETPHITKCQAAPCHRPLAAKTTSQLKYLRIRPFLPPPRGIYR